jgi:glycosyltransferase involved in cell wall biosynthesis
MHIGLIHYTAPPIIGGVETTIGFQARFLADAGHDVLILAGDGERFDPRLEWVCIPELNSRHPEVLAVKAELDRGESTARFQGLRTKISEALAPVIRSLDAVIVHNALSLHKNLAMTSALWSLAHEPPPRWIAWHHDLAWDRPDYAAELHEGEPWDRLRTVVPGARQVAVSRAVQSRVARVFSIPASTVTVIPPGVDEASFARYTESTHRVREVLDLERADLLFLLPSRVTRRKNIALAIRIVAELRLLASIDARLLVTGPPGPHNPKNAAYLDELQALATALHVEEAVHFLYRLDPQDPHPLDDATLADLFRLCDALLLPSLDEGFGIPVLEAGLARLPVFCSDIPPFRESGGADITRFALDADPGDIAREILAVLGDDRSLRLRRRVRHDYAWNRLLTERLIPLLEGSPDG